MKMKKIKKNPNNEKKNGKRKVHKENWNRRK